MCKTFQLNTFTGRGSIPLYWCCLAAFSVICVSGCGDFFSEKAIELESRNIIREQSRIIPPQELKNPVPEIYKQPPLIVEGSIGDQKDARLYYFSKYHNVDKLAALINTQFVKTFRNNKGKEYPVPDYAVSPNLPTNQLIVRCPTVTDAEQVLAFLEYTDVPPIQVKIDCLISEVYADHTMDWETTLMIENLLGEKISLGGKGGAPVFPGAALRDIARASFGLKAGFIQNEGITGHEFKALVDLLESRGYLKILMNPQLEVVNGQTASIMTSEKVPLDTISNVHPVSGQITTRTEYENVVDRLEITPHVFADGYIGIKTKMLIGSKDTPHGVKQTPIVTKREIQIEENRIRQGESLVIGGIRKTEKRAVVRGVPFLKDLPLIGILFSSKDFEERTKEVLFIITPSISSGGIPNEEIVAKLREKHKMVAAPPSLTESITDPFGTGAYMEKVEDEAVTAEIERIKAEMQRSHAERQTEWLTEELRKATAQAAAQKIAAEKAYAEMQKAKTAAAESEKAKVEAEAKAKADAEAKTKTEAEKAAAEKAKTAAESAAKVATEKATAAEAATKAAVEKAAKAEIEKDAAQKALAEAKAEKPTAPTPEPPPAPKPAPVPTPEPTEPPKEPAPEKPADKNN